MRIVGWTWWGNPDYKKAYDLMMTRDEFDKRRDVVASELRKRNYKFNGGYHQNGNYGVPIFDDGVALQCTQREWGAIMVKAYPDEIDNSDGMGYCTWAWVSPEPLRIPSESDYVLEGICTVEDM